MLSARRGQAGILLSHSLLVQLITFLLRPATTYRAIELATPAAWLGVLSACFAIAPLVLALPSGALVDRVGERRTAIAGAVLITSSGALLAALGHGVIALAAGSVLLGVGHLCSVVAQQTLVANSARASGLDAAFGHYTFAASLGQSLGPAVILLFSDGGSVPHTQGIFVAATVAGLALVGLSLPFATSATHAATPRPQVGGLGSLLRLPGLARALLTSCTILAAVDITLVYLPALGAERGIEASAIGLLLTVRGVASMTSRLFLGRLTTLIGRRKLLITGTFVAAVTLAGAALPVSVAVIAVLMALAGLGLGVGQPITMSWLAASAPSGARGRAMSLRLVGNRAGQVVLPSLAGALAAGTGAAGVLCATGAGLAVIAAAARNLPVDEPGDPTASR